MRTRRPTMSMEGTIEVIDLTHASEEEAMATLLRELRSRRERRSGTPAGPALVFELGRLRGARGEPPDRAPDVPAGARAEGGRAAQDPPPFSFADLGDVLRQMAAAPGDGAAPEPERAGDQEPAPAPPEERAEMEQFFAERTVILKGDAAGKMMAAAVVGFGLGAAAMLLARRVRYVAPPSSRRERPRRPRVHVASDAEWQAQLDEIARRYADPGDSSDGDDEQDEDEPAHEE